MNKALCALFVAAVLTVNSCEKEPVRTPPEKPAEYGCPSLRAQVDSLEGEAWKNVFEAERARQTKPTAKPVPVSPWEWAK